MREIAAWRETIASVSGLFTGGAAGLIGIGGSEFRIPILVEFLKLPLAIAGEVNFAVGVFTVVLGARIPALLYLFGVPIVEACTASLAVSIPTLVPRAFTQRRTADNVPVLSSVSRCGWVLHHSSVC